MKSALKITAVIILSIYLTGCASILSKNMYPVTINSHPDDASILVVDERGTQIYKGKTPSTITLTSGESYFHAKKYSVTFSKAGFENQTAEIRAGLDGWYIGNILFGGLIGILIVDPITGNMWTLPKELTVTLVGKDAAGKVESTLNIVTIDQLPERFKKRLIRIN